MKPLPTQFTKQGFEFTQIKRVGMLAIYVKQSLHNKGSTYEVIRVQSHNGRTIAGKYFEPAEYFPSSEQWGTHGFTCRTMESAEKRMWRMI
jgi:hypothetical protein